MTTVGQAISALKSIADTHGEDMPLYVDTGDLVLPAGFITIHKGQDTSNKRVAGSGSF